MRDDFDSKIEIIVMVDELFMFVGELKSDQRPTIAERQDTEQDDISGSKHLLDNQ